MDLYEENCRDEQRIHKQDDRKFPDFIQLIPRLTRLTIQDLAMRNNFRMPATSGDYYG